MIELPLIIVVGGDDLALRVCAELAAGGAHEITLLWEESRGFAARARDSGARFHGLPPNDYASLAEAGVARAACIMPVSLDDRLNLQIALKARDLNPNVRIVLRQFNRTLGRKIEQNLPNCTAVSPAANAAATYAAAAVDPSCKYALQFPDIDGDLIGFSERPARDLGVIGNSISGAERRLRLRIVCCNGAPVPDRERRLRESDCLVVCGAV